MGPRSDRAEKLAKEIDEEDPDETTRREALEQRLLEEDLSKEGEGIGEALD